MKLTIIRHGRTLSNAERKYCGCGTDDPLTAAGRSEIREVSRGYVNLFVSPMIRARETAAIMFPDAEQTVIEDLREMDFGIFEGRTHAEMDGEPEYQEWLDSMGSFHIPDGESLGVFRERSMQGLRKALRSYAAGRFDEMFIVAHGGTVMALMSALTGEDYYDFYSDNGCGYTIDLEVDDAGNIITAGAYDRFCGRVSPGSGDR